MLDSDASTAKTLTLAAIILQLVFFAIGVIGVLFFAMAFTSVTSPPTVGTAAVGLAASALILVVFSVFFLIGIVWILLDYFLVYRKLAKERVREAETPSLVLGIVQLIFSGVISGILLIIAYVKIRDSIARNSSQPKQNPPI